MPSGIKKLLLPCVDAAVRLVQPIASRIAFRQAKDISLECHRRALASTADFVLRHMSKAKAVANKEDLLRLAFQQADTSGDRLICEFGVYTGGTINYLAEMTSKPLFGFDSFEGLPEQWGSMGKGHFAVARLPEVRSNVTLIKGWFNETLPPFLAQNKGMVGFLHVDCDLYSSTKTVFEALEPRLAPGTVIVFDEYFNYPGWEEGEHKAFIEYLSKTGRSFEPLGYHGCNEQAAFVLK